MKKKIIALSSVLLTISSVSFAGIRVADSHGGAWVTVTDDGQPAANAEITIENQPQIQATFKTNENGRVFVPISTNHSTSVKYKAKTSDGNSFETVVFHSE